MKIAFYEITSSDQKYVQKQLKGHKLSFYEHQLNHVNLPAEDTEILSIHAHSTIDKQALNKLPNLRYIQTRTAGSDHIDLAECKKRGIVVSYAPGVNSTSVAEFVFVLLLSLVRNLHMACAQCAKGGFAEGGYTGTELAGKTMGIVGTGAVGAKTAILAKGFGMKVLVYDVSKNPRLSKHKSIQYVPIKALLKQSDIISLHVPLLPTTKHMINSTTIASMKKGVFLINTARGAVVDTQALVSALKSGKIAGAGLDVLEDELALRKNQQKTLSKQKQQMYKDMQGMMGKNLLVTPHVAYSSIESNRRILDTALSDIHLFVKGKLKNVIV